MKSSKFFLFALVLSAAVFAFSSCEKEEGVDVIDQTKGVIGRWYSSGTNVSALLRGAPFLTDSIYVEFKDNFTFRVEAYTAARVMTLFTGTFAQQQSPVSGIWTITLQQNVPTAGVSEGIFQIHWDENPIRMRYEILQTTPALGFAPPTPQAGFGSTAGGAFGMTNVQTFLRMN